MREEQNLSKLNFKLTEEKQPIEKFIDNLKIAFFDLTYLLIKQQSENYMIQIIIIILQFLELMAFPFSPYLTNYWDNKYFIITSDFFQYFQLVHLWKGNTAFFIIGYIINALFIVTFISFIIYVMIKLAQFKLKTSWPIKLLDFFFTIESLIILPVSKIFLSVFNCQNGVNYYAEGIKCYSGTHIAMMIISIILLLVFAFISVLVHLIYFEFRNKKQNINGKLTSRTEIELLIAKGVLLIMFELLYFNAEILIGCNLIISLFLFWEYIVYEPYYNEIINMLYVIMYLVFFLASVLPFLSLILLSFTQFNGSFPLFLLGCPLIIAGQWIMKKRKIEMQYLLMPLGKMPNGYTALKQIKYFLTLIDTQEYNNFHKDQLFIAGYIKHYELSCFDIDCPLKKYLNTPRGNSKDTKIFLLQHVEGLYKSAISRFPSDVKLRVSFSNFIYEKLNKKQKGLLEISNAEKYSPSFEEEFFLYKCKKIIDDEVEVTSVEDNIDYVSAIAYKGYMNTFKTFINKVVILYIEFWQLLLINDESKAENFTKMSEMGNKINKFVEEINQNLIKMEKINPNDADIYKTYSQFLSDVLNDQHKATIYNAKQNEIEDNKHKYDENNLLNLNFKALAKSEEYKYIVVSALTDNFGCITNISLNICIMFGFSRNDLIGQTLDLIMPEMFQADHRKLLLEKYNVFKQIGITHKGDTSGNNNNNQTLSSNNANQLKEVVTFGRNKTKYLIPLRLKAGISSTEDGEYYFVTKVFNDIHVSRDEYHSQQCVILTDTDLIIQNFTANSIKLLNMNSYNMNNCVEITGFIKEYREELLKQAISNEEQSTVARSKQMKKHAINKKFRTPIEITWYMGDNATPSFNISRASFRFKSTQNNRHESTESFHGFNEEPLRPVPKLTSKLAVYNNSYATKKFFLIVEDVTILSKHVGYSFKFDTSNYYTQSKYRTSNSIFSSIKLVSQKFENGAFNHLNDQTPNPNTNTTNINASSNPKVRTSNQNASIGSNKHLVFTKEQIMSGKGGTGVNESSLIVNSFFNSNITNEFIPELGTQFNIDVKDLAFKQNVNENINIREELKAMAKNKIQLGTTLITNIHSSDSIDESFYTSSDYNNNKSESEASSEPASFSNNNININQIPSHNETIKKQQVNDSYYHVNLSPLILFMYNFAKGGVSKVENPGIGQVEYKIKEKDETNSDENYVLPVSKDQKNKRVIIVQGENKQKIENANIPENLILIKQIKQALNNKELQPTIINLVIFTFIVFCILISSALICLFCFFEIKTNVNMNFELIMKAFSFHQGLIYSIFHVRELVLLSSGKYNNIYDTDIERYITNQTVTALEYFSSNEYTLTNISTVFNSLSSKNQKAMNDLNSSIEVLEKNLKIKTYSLPIYAAFVELNYALFHTTRLRFKDIKALNENIFYFLRNSINNSIINSKAQIDIFLSEFFCVTLKSQNLVYILMAACFVMYLIAYFIFSYFYEAVERRKESYLAVFYEIGKGFIVNSLYKCEKFCQRIQIEHDSESKNISINSSFYSSVNNDLTPINQSPASSIDMGLSRKSKRYESQNKVNKLKGLFVLSIIGAYLLGLFIFILDCLSLFDKYINFAFHYSNYQNDYILLFITIRELMFDPNASALQLPIKTYIEDVFYSFYSKGEKDKNKVKNYLGSTPKEFQKVYFETKNGNLCKYAIDFNKEFHISKLDDEAFCSEFISNSTSLGLDSLLSYYIEENRSLKNIIFNYDKYYLDTFSYNNTLNSEYEDKLQLGKTGLESYSEYDPFNLFNLEGHKNLLIVHRYIIKKIFASLLEKLVICYMSSLDFRALAILITVSCLIGLITIAYTAIWIPFQINLNETVTISI